MESIFTRYNLNFDNSDYKYLNQLLLLQQTNFILEIKIKKQESELEINDKEEFKECYFIILENVDDIVNIFSLSKYLIYYEEDALKNYISKYIYDIINLFLNLNDSTLNFFEDFGLTNKENSDILFPLKNTVEKIRNLSEQGKLLTYFKSNQTSFFDYIEKFLHIKENSNKRKSLNVEFHRYLKYKTIMDDRIIYKKSFKIKKILKDIYSKNNDKYNTAQNETSFIKKNSENLIHNSDTNNTYKNNNIYSNEINFMENLIKQEINDIIKKDPDNIEIESTFNSSEDFTNEKKNNLKFLQ